LIGKPDKVRYFEEKARRLGLDTISQVFDENPEWKNKQPFKSKIFHDRIVQSHTTYAAMLASMDENLGKVINELKRLGLYDNTIIIFTSDNGGLSTSEGSPTSNLPLKAGKGYLYEGGIREPLIAVWKNHIPAGETNENVVSSVDYFPTILDLAGVAMPKNLVIDGVSAKEAFMGATRNRGSIFWHYPHYPNQGSRPGGAIREGNYKLIEFYDNGELELYNIKEDISERTNLVKKDSKRVAKMAKKLADWRKSVNAKMPTPNPRYKKTGD
jgi:arylsulfatase A-like enzyme